MKPTPLFATAVTSLLLASVSTTCLAENASNTIKNAQGVELTILDEPMMLAEADTQNAVPSNTVKTNNIPIKTSSSNDSKAVELDKIQIKSKRLRIVTPMPGVAIDRTQSTTNIQSASGKELAESKALNVTEFMNGEMASVSVSDYAGNPFQQDLNFRGFTASPSIGTPQGISVYLDGVRINEAFGEVVNWDLIPMNALASLDLIPGTNPLFGLNTLGGALALRTKTGFTDEHLRAQTLGGAWGRQQIQVSNGVNNGTFGLFSAYNHFAEDGWRDNSPSNVRQLYNVATLKLPLGELNLSALNVRTKLTGNGMIPYETAAINQEAVYTSPDVSSNKLDHYNLNGHVDLSDTMSISALAYKRNVEQNATGGDIYESYKALLSAWGGDLDGDGVDDVSALNGMINRSELSQNSTGGALQFAVDLDTHQITAGLSYDKNNLSFMQAQSLAQIDANHNISLTSNPAFEAAGYGPIVSFPGVIRNNLTGSSVTKSLFFSDTWSPKDTLHITYGARYNATNVKNNLRSDRGKDLYNFSAGDFSAARSYCKVDTDPFIVQSRARWICTEGDYNYYSFNPAVGIAAEVVKNTTVYANISRGARTPSVIELGCAKDHTLVPTSTNYQDGCSIPTALSADPYLKQVRSTSYETGIRGTNQGFDWNLGVFRTELTDDILFVPLGRKNRGLFDNFGETLRQGIEMGMKGEIGKSKLGLNYTYLRATYESAAQIINEANSTNSAPQTLQAYVNIKPGDELPGMPNHIVQANWNYRFDDHFDTTLSMVMHSSSYVRGNENNNHQARAATHQDFNGDGLDRDRYDYIGSGKLSGYAVFNLKANYKFDHGITLFAKVDNLFNRTYATAGDLGRNPFDAQGTFQVNPANVDGDWNNTTFIGPGAPRAAWVGLNVDLDWKKLKQANKK